MLTRRFAALLIAGATAFAAQADSDGYYCVGATYLAYELRLSQPDGQHVLNILRAKSDQSIEKLQLTLPDFQVHGMRCDSDAVKLAGWDAIHTVDLSSDSSRVSVERLPRPGDIPDWPQTNLGQWNRDARNSSSATIELPWSVPHFVKITIASTQKECVNMLSSRLYRPGMTQPVLTLLEHEFKAECGE